MQGALDTLRATIDTGRDALKPPGLSLKAARSMGSKVQRDITRVTSVGGLPEHELLVAAKTLTKSIQEVVDKESAELRELIDKAIEDAQNNLDWGSVRQTIDECVRAGLKPYDEGAKRGWAAIEELKAREAAPVIKAAEEANALAIQAAERAAAAKQADELAAKTAAKEKAEAEAATAAVAKEEAEALAAAAKEEKEQKEAGGCTLRVGNQNIVARLIHIHIYIYIYIYIYIFICIFVWRALIFLARLFLVFFIKPRLSK